MKRFYLYTIGIFIIYFQIAFLNSFSFFRVYLNVDIAAIFLYSMYIVTKSEIIDAIFVLGLLSDLLTNSTLGVHSLVYFIVFIVVRFFILKLNMGIFLKYISIFLFGILHSVLFNFLISKQDVFSSIEFSLLLTFAVFILNTNKSDNSGWFA